MNFVVTLAGVYGEYTTNGIWRAQINNCVHQLKDAAHSYQTHKYFIIMMTRLETSYSRSLIVIITQLDWRPINHKNNFLVEDRIYNTSLTKDPSIPRIKCTYQFGIADDLSSQNILLIFEWALDYKNKDLLTHIYASKQSM